MKSIKGVLNHFILTCLLVLSLFLFARQALADIPAEENDGTIEIVYPAQALSPFNERKSDWSIIGGVNVDLIYPDKFRSKIDNSSYDGMFESYPMTMYQFEFGTKRNTSLGAFGIGMLIGYGEIDGRRSPGQGLSPELRRISLTKMALTGTYTLDTLFEEPYVAPYISGQVFKYDWRENNLTKNLSTSGSTSPAFAITLGALIQLNWIEPDTALQAQTASGLQNTFLDIFVSQYNTSSSESDPNFETNLNFGGGLKLEF